MSSRTRDIASILGKTEANNSANIRLLKVGDAVASDEETLADITVDGGGNVDRVLASSVTVGDAVILKPNNQVEKVGQPFEPWSFTHHFLMDSDGTGGATDSYRPYNYQGYESQWFYIGQSKVIYIAVQGTSGRGALFARMFRLDPTGHRVEKMGPICVVQSSYYNSSTSYGGVRANAYCSVQGENNRIHTCGEYEYYSSWSRSNSYMWTCYPADVDDPDNLTIVVGNSSQIEGTSNSYQNNCSRPFAYYVREDMVNEGVNAGYHNHTNYHGGAYYYYRPSYGDYRLFLFRTSGNTHVGTNSSGVQTLSSSTYQFDMYNHAIRPWYDKRSNKMLGLGGTNAGGLSTYSLALHEFQVYPGNTSQYDNPNIEIATSSQWTSSHYYNGCYDSNARASIIAYADNSYVGQLKVIKGNSSYSTDPTIGSSYEFAPRLDNKPSLFHDKATGKTAVLWNQSQGGQKGLVRWFTADSDGTISLEDSTHPLFPDSAFTNSIGSYTQPIHKLEDFDTCIMDIFKNWAPQYPGKTWNGSGGGYQNTLSILHPERRQSTNLTSQGANYLGIAQETGDSGDTINIKIHGAIDTNQVGLSPNTTYYLNEINGDLEPNTNNGSIRAGYAVAANQLKILTLNGESA